MRQCALVATTCWLLPGIVLHYSGAVLWNTDLYSVSFLLFTSGVSGLLFCAIYFLVDERSGSFDDITWRDYVKRGLFGFR
jgi:hypothetical protein